MGWESVVGSVDAEVRGQGLTCGSIVQRMFALVQVFYLRTSISSSVKWIKAQRQLPFPYR